MASDKGKAARDDDSTDQVDDIDGDSEESNDDDRSTYIAYLGLGLVSSVFVGFGPLSDALAGNGPFEHAMGRFLACVGACVFGAAVLGRILESAPPPEPQPEPDPAAGRDEVTEAAMASGSDQPEAQRSENG